MSNKKRTDHQAQIVAVGAIEPNTSGLVSPTDVTDAMVHQSDSAMSRLDSDPYIRYATTVSGTDTVAITISNDYPDAYSAEVPVLFVPAVANTGAFTVNVNGLGALGVYDMSGNLLSAANTLITTQGYVIVWSTAADGGTTDGWVLIDVTTSTGSSLTVANQGDNRIVTATATADALNAESGATFDGTDLVNDQGEIKAGVEEITIGRLEMSDILSTTSSILYKFLAGSTKTLGIMAETAPASDITADPAIVLQAKQNDDTDIVTKDILHIYNNASKLLGIDKSGDLTLVALELSSAGVQGLFRTATNSSLTIRGSTSGGTGGQIELFGSTHATRANEVEIVAGGTAVIIDTNNDWDFQANDLTTGGNLIFDVDGAGIDFSQSAGGGASSSILDDYEEGTKTITMRDATSGGNTGSTTTAYYTKKGDEVHISFSITNMSTAGMTAGNTLFLTGLPYNVHASVTGVGSIYYDDIIFTAGKSQLTVVGASDYLLIQESGNNIADASVLVSGITSGSSDVSISINYKTV